jgi:hypothetical protein
MMKIFVKYILWLSLLWLNISNIFALSVQIPTPSGQDDIIVAESTIESDESTIFDIIQIVNDYLWFAIAGVAMVLIVISGLKLILADWNKEETTKANRMIVSAIIAIFAAMLSYAVIKLVVNLF